MLLFTGHPVRVREVAASAARAAGCEASWRNFPMRFSDRFEVGFFMGQPLHLRFERLSLTLWRVIGPWHPYPILHSWAHVYPSWASLLGSVSGIAILNSLE